MWKWLARLAGPPENDMRSAVLYAPALPQVQFLVDAAATSGPDALNTGRSGALISVMASLEARDRENRKRLISRTIRPS